MQIRSNSILFQFNFVYSAQIKLYSLKDNNMEQSELTINLHNFLIKFKYIQQVIQISINQQKDDCYYWANEISNLTMSQPLKKYLKTIQKAFQYISKKPKERVDFESIWVMQNNQGQTIIDKNYGKLIIKIQICDQIAQTIQLKVSKKQYNQIQKLKKLNYKIQGEKCQIQQKLSILQKEVQNLKKNLLNKDSQFQLQRKKYEQTIHQLKSQISSFKFITNPQNFQNQSYLSLPLSKSQIKKQKQNKDKKQQINFKNFVKKQDNKFTLKLEHKLSQVGDIIQLMKYKWDNIDALYIGNNYFGDQGLKILSKGNWPKLKQLYLQDSELTQIFHLKNFNLDQLQVLNIHTNYLTQSSSKFIVSQKWPKLHDFGISFLQKSVKNGWKQLFSNMLKQMPVLKTLSIFIFQNIDRELKQKIMDWSRFNNIKLKWYNKKLKQVRKQQQILMINEVQPKSQIAE